MNSSTKYIGMDVHKESISIAVRNAAGKIVMECVIETKASIVLQFFDGLRGDLHVTFEEGTWAAWLHDLLKPHVSKVMLCDPRRNALLQDGNQNDRVDACKLSDLLYMNKLSTVYHGDHGLRTLKELGRSYLTITRDQSRVMTRVKAIYRSCYSLQWQAGLWLAASDRVADQDRTTRSAPAGGVVLPAAGCSANLAPASAKRSAHRE